MGANTKVNGVTRTVQDDGAITWDFPKGIVEVKPNATQYQIYKPGSPDTPAYTQPFATIADKLGAENIVDYVDAAAEEGLFFDAGIEKLRASIPSAIINVEEASQLAGALRSDVVYHIGKAGGIDMGSQSITVPADGLYIEGLSIKLTALYSSEPNYTMFVGGGDFFPKNMQIEVTGSNSKVHDLTDPDGTHSAEYNDVIFLGCTSLGKLTNYAQGLYNNVGGFSYGEGLGLFGAWAGGFTTRTAIVRGGASGSKWLYADPLATFNSHIASNANIVVPSGAIGYEFIPANFTFDQQFELVGGIFAGPGTYVSGITVQSTRCKWLSTNLPETTPGAKWEVLTESATAIANTADYFKLSVGSVTASAEIWAQVSGNRITWLSSVSATIDVLGTISLIAGNNNQLIVNLRQWDASASAWIDHILPAITSNGAGRAENLAILDKFEVAEGDYIEVWARNTSATSAITMLNNSRLFIEIVKSV
jgi:hypothetical protein